MMVRARWVGKGGQRAFQAGVPQRGRDRKEVTQSSGEPQGAPCHGNDSIQSALGRRTKMRRQSRLLQLTSDGGTPGGKERATLHFLIPPGQQRSVSRGTGAQEALALCEPRRLPAPPQPCSPPSPSESLCARHPWGEAEGEHGFTPGGREGRPAWPGSDPRASVFCRSRSCMDFRQQESLCIARGPGLGMALGFRAPQVMLFTPRVSKGVPRMPKSAKRHLSRSPAVVQGHSDRERRCPTCPRTRSFRESSQSRRNASVPGVAFSCNRHHSG